jgi:hypothetical protein
MPHDLISSFNAGELSPYLESRTNLDKYRSGCKILENFIITPYGPANRRAGTEYLGATKLSSTRSRLIGLNLSDANRIVMELGVGYVRFWKDGALLLNGGSPVEAVGVDYLGALTGTTPHPYQEADLRGVQICQINNLVYLTHPSYPPQRLSRFSDTDWKMGEIPFGDASITNNWAPMLDQNVTETTLNPSSSSTGTLTSVSFAYSTTIITATKANHQLAEGQEFVVSAATGASAASYNGTWIVDEVVSSSVFKFVVTAAPTAVSTGTVTFERAAQAGEVITITASTGIFKGGHLNSYWELAHQNSTTFISHAITSANATSTTIKILGKWTLQTFGTWTARVELQSSTDNGATWKTARTYTSTGDYNAVSDGETVVETLFRLRVRGFKAGASSTAPRVIISPIDPTLKGLVRITEVTNATTVKARVLRSLGGTGPTSQWREGAFSTENKFPSAVSMHESRLIFGGTEHDPSTIWGSASNDFQNFKTGAYDADSYSFTLASTTGGRVQWILSKTALIIGTTQDEWSLSSSDGTRPLTPTNVLAKKQSNYGSGSVPGRIVNDTVIYVQKMGRKLREFVYSFNSDSWVSMDLTALGEHVTRTGILETAYQRVPDAILWIVRGDGQLVSMTYEKEQQVVGFARHLIAGGEVESVATVTGINAEDEVYVSVKRVINGATVRYIERLKTGMRDALDTADKSNWWFVDSGKLQTFGSPTATITGLGHLEGQTVSVWADNAVGSLIVTQPTVVSGSITLQLPASRVLVGLPFTSTLSPSRIAAQMQDGTSLGRKMRIPRMNVKVYQSLAGEYSTDQITWNPLVSRTTSDAMDSSPAVINGFERAYVSSNWSDGVDLFIRQTLPVPLTVAAIVPTWEASEGSN